MSVGADLSPGAGTDWRSLVFLHGGRTIDGMKNAALVPLSELRHKLKTRQARIGIVSMGYVGLPLALLFSVERFRVTGFDIAADKVATLNAGRFLHRAHSA